MKGISVIICCYNSALRIGSTLLHLKDQNISKDIPWEVILVDNNCTDNTIEVAKSYWNTEVKIPLEIVVEERVGQMFARKTGVFQASYDCMVFCDDDNHLRSDYLMTVYETLESNKMIGAVGGQSVPSFPNTVIKPEWFEDRKSGYAVGEQKFEKGYLPKGKTLWGAGLSVRRKAILPVFDDRFPLLLSGRKAGILTSGDDSEVCHRIQIIGYELYYEPKLFLTHYIDSGRLTEDYYSKLRVGFSHSWGVLNLYQEFIFVIITRGFNPKAFFLLIYRIFLKHDKNALLKLLRVAYWKFGIPFYKSHDMVIIKGLFRKYHKERFSSGKNSLSIPPVQAQNCYCRESL